MLIIVLEVVLFACLTVARVQANEIGPPTLVGTWEKPARQLYLEFLESPKVSKIPDEEVSTLTAVHRPSHCVLRRDARAHTHTHTDT